MSNLEYARKYRETNRSLINARRRAQRAEAAAALLSEAPISESMTRNRRCRQCGDRCTGSSYYYCELHKLGLEDDGVSEYSIGSLDSAREE